MYKCILTVCDFFSVAGIDVKYTSWQFKLLFTVVMLANSPKCFIPFGYLILISFVRTSPPKAYKDLAAFPALFKSNDFSQVTTTTSA